MHVLVLGSGQLARMMSLAGAPLNIRISALDVDAGNIVHPLTQQRLICELEDTIAQVDVITAEFEHIPHDILEICEKSGKLIPSAGAIKAGGDRRVEKNLLEKANVPNARHCIIETREDFDRAISHLGLPLVLKSALGGYDGKGQWRLTKDDQIETVWPEIAQCLASGNHQAIVAEQFVPFEREVSIVGTRGKDGNIALYPLAENTHTHGVLALSTAIDEPLLQQQAEAIFAATAKELDYVGVLALEFFELDGTLLVNEIAPRVHNSGHWTQQGAETCQFENHLRAVCGLPLGSTSLTRPTSMINILGEDVLPNEILTIEGCHIHWYGKEKRAGRKMGHINVSSDDNNSLKQTLSRVANLLDVDAFPALHQYTSTFE
ncbi:5-(carboxyamino)imidazole ribonucleotide synthase [Vibrio caribbeanicus]|uniref:5-(carboxyamino)imidazole ribonucleotide synthase n=1 Tax=Vibrio caribbeanicus TaxID=701175 RepID=UPI0022853528|nr:5-(carboxyamino)imidazole ribonucleotide synthase [Vibrio caribbeanicus]MCY9845414.1 5-(carboxyamino)imidazole ribonucleotide synthase [Vibrio caribbeanicus]